MPNGRLQLNLPTGPASGDFYTIPNLPFVVHTTQDTIQIKHKLGDQDKPVAEVRSEPTGLSVEWESDFVSTDRTFASLIELLAWAVIEYPTEKGIYRLQLSEVARVELALRESRERIPFALMDLPLEWRANLPNGWSPAADGAKISLSGNKAKVDALWERRDKPPGLVIRNSLVTPLDPPRVNLSKLKHDSQSADEQVTKYETTIRNIEVTIAEEERKQHIDELKTKLNQAKNEWASARQNSDNLESQYRSDPRVKKLDQLEERERKLNRRIQKEPALLTTVEDIRRESNTLQQQLDNDKTVAELVRKMGEAKANENAKKASFDLLERELKDRQNSPQLVGLRSRLDIPRKNLDKWKRSSSEANEARKKAEVEDKDRSAIEEDLVRAAQWELQLVARQSGAVVADVLIKRKP